MHFLHFLHFYHILSHFYHIFHIFIAFFVFLSHFLHFSNFSHFYFKTLKSINLQFFTPFFCNAPKFTPFFVPHRGKFTLGQSRFYDGKFTVVNSKKRSKSENWSKSLMLSRHAVISLVYFLSGCNFVYLRCKNHSTVTFLISLLLTRLSI